MIECFVEGANFALGKQEKDAEVFFLENGNGMYDISKVKSAPSHDNETQEITGDEFVILQ